MKKSPSHALEYADHWLEIIKNPSLPDRTLAKEIIVESTNNFDEYFNRELFASRKSTTLAKECGLIDWACIGVEWNGLGSRFRDILGREYIDWLWGYGMMNHGWSHPDIIEAVQAQLLRSPMPTQELIDPLRGVLAKLLANITPWNLQYSFFAASWTEANEGAIKLAKMYTKKSWFITSVWGFHGKTLGSLSMMGKREYREPLWTLYGWPVYHVPFWDAGAIENQLEICEQVWIDIAAVILEPIQGEAGAIVPPDDFWPRVRRATRKYRVLLIADEVQTGLGRTGKLWGVNHWDIAPDIMTIAKSLGGGVMPVSAFISTPEIWETMMSPNPFIHTTTTGGWPLACAAAIASIHVTLRDDYAKLAGEKGKYLMDNLLALRNKYPAIYESITGKWLLIWQHFRTPEIGYRVISELFDRGVLVAGTLNNAKTVRIEPPIMISYEDIDTGLTRLEEALRVVANTGRWDDAL